MSISIYYKAQRKKQLTDGEINHVTVIAKQYSVDSKIESFLATGHGLNWESFDFRINTCPSSLFKKGIVLEGSTKLPDNTENASWEGIQHWCKCLTALRQELPNCDWYVSVEDHEIPWLSSNNAYNPSF